MRALRSSTLRHSTLSRAVSTLPNVRRLCTAPVGVPKCADHIATEKQNAAEISPEPTPEPSEESLRFLQERATNLGMTLSLEERKLIIADADKNGDGKLSTDDWNCLVDRHARAQNERLTLAQYILNTIDQHRGQHVLRWTARMGQCFFAICGANIAGEAGMHAIGATVVGVTAAVTGGTFNQVLLQQPVGWIRDSRLLAMLIAFCLAGFYLWPLADRFVERSRQSGGIASDLRPLFDSISPPGETNDSAAGHPVRYCLESIALGSAAVVAAQQGILVGLHPLACACLAITIAFGGAARDVLCQREIRLMDADGSQSYAVSSFVGALVYVSLRELHVWNCSGNNAMLLSGGIPVSFRIVLSICSACGVRWLAWRHRKEDDLFWTMEEALRRNDEVIRPWFEVVPHAPPPAAPPPPPPLPPPPRAWWRFWCDKYVE